MMTANGPLSYSADRRSVRWDCSACVLVRIIIIINIIIISFNSSSSCCCSSCSSSRIPVTTFTHGIYNNVPQTSPVYTVYSVAAVLYLQSVLHVMLFRPYNTFCTFTSALRTVCAQCTIWLLSAVP
jgi:hypothetical protein